MACGQYRASVPLTRTPGRSPRGFSDSPFITIRRNYAGCRRPCLPMRSERKACWQTTTRTRFSSAMACRCFREARHQTTTRIRFCTPCRCLRRDWTFIPKDGGLSARSKWGEIYAGYAQGDLPVSEKACSRLVFLPALTDPIPHAAERLIAAIDKIARHAEMIVQSIAV